MAANYHSRVIAAKADVSKHGYFILLHVIYHYGDASEVMYVLGGWDCKVIFDYHFYEPNEVV